MLKYRINCHTKINLQIIIPNVIKSALGDIYNVTSNISAVTCKTMSTNSSRLKTRHCSAIRLLKATARESAEILQVIFQRSIDEGVLPEDWKKALITPVYKKASRSDPANYRPVSLTCISCKLLEHIVNRHILNHLDAQKILADSQHGFRKRRSCETQLLLTCHDLT